MRKVAAAAFVLASLAAPAPAGAWGFEAHKYIMERAIPLLPAELRPFFLKYQVSLVEHAIDPDLWRTAGWEAETPRHFVDMDAYGPYPFKDLPHDYQEAVKRYGQDFVDRNGTLPWRAEEIYRKLVEAFTQKSSYSRENIKFFASVIAHYAGDANVPFHAALNHDGQLTGQTGLHSRFEADLFDRMRPGLRLTPQPSQSVANAREFMFATLTESFSFVQQILDADKAAATGRELYDDAYFAAFQTKAGPILERRLADSITAVASLITSAWIEAGRPAIVEQPRTARPIKR
jgi:hypothetical protein